MNRRTLLGGLAALPFISTLFRKQMREVFVMEPKQDWAIMSRKIVPTPGVVLADDGSDEWLVENGQYHANSLENALRFMGCNPRYTIVASFRYPSSASVEINPHLNEKRWEGIPALQLAEEGHSMREQVLGDKWYTA